MERNEIEIWKDIDGYSGLYQVSNLGRVKSLANDKSRKEKIIKPRVLKSGYLIITLSKKGKNYEYYLHRIVANAFIPNPENKLTVNHKNELKSDNRSENLEWMTLKENTNYGSRNAKISEAMKGRTFTKEHRKHLSEAQKKRFANKRSEN